MSFAAGSTTTTQTITSPAVYLSLPFISQSSSSLNREFTLLKPFTLKWCKLVIDKLADAIYRHQHLEDYLTQNIVEWASRVFQIDLEEVANSEDYRLKCIELINELSKTILINPLTLDSGKSAEPLVNPMSDGVWWWEKGSADQPWTLEHYKRISLVDPPVSVFDKKELKAFPHLLAEEVIAIRNAILKALPPALFPKVEIRSEEKACLAPSASLPMRTVIPLDQNGRTLFFVQYFQKAQAVMDVQTERERQRLLKLEGHKVALLRLEMQKKLSQEVERLEKMVTDNQEQLEQRIKSIEEENRGKVSTLQTRLDAIKTELSAASTKLAKVSKQCTAQAIAIGALQENYKQKLNEINDLKSKEASLGAEIDHSGGCCLIM